MKSHPSRPPKRASFLLRIPTYSLMLLLALAGRAAADVCPPLDISCYDTAVCPSAECTPRACTDAYRVGPGRPFQEIQAALNAIPVCADPVNNPDACPSYVVCIDPGTYFPTRAFRDADAGIIISKPNVTLQVDRPAGQPDSCAKVDCRSLNPGQEAIIDGSQPDPLATPAAPTVTVSPVGGFVAPGTYYTIIKYANPGVSPTPPRDGPNSPETPSVVVSATSTLTVTSPPASAGATRYYVFTGIVSGGPYSLQNGATGTLIGTNVVLGSTPSTSTSNLAPLPNYRLKTVISIRAHNVTVRGLTVRNGRGDLIDSTDLQGTSDRLKNLRVEYNILTSSRNIGTVESVTTDSSTSCTNGRGDEGVQLRWTRCALEQWNSVTNVDGDCYNITNESVYGTIQHNYCAGSHTRDGAITIYWKDTNSITPEAPANDSHACIYKNVIQDVTRGDFACARGCMQTGTNEGFVNAGILMGTRDGNGRNVVGGKIWQNIIEGTEGPGIMLFSKGNELRNNHVNSSQGTLRHVSECSDTIPQQQNVCVAAPPATPVVDDPYGAVTLRDDIKDTHIYCNSIDHNNGLGNMSGLIYGIRVGYTNWPHDTLIQNNCIFQNDRGVYYHHFQPPYECCFQPCDPNEILNATMNYWGDPLGPYDPGMTCNPPGPDDNYLGSAQAIISDPQPCAYDATGFYAVCPVPDFPPDLDCGGGNTGQCPQGSTGPCDDSNPCTIDEHCLAGVCTGGTNVTAGSGTCTDNNLCTSYTTVPGEVDHCDGNGMCKGNPVVCPEGNMNICDTESCNAGTGVCDVHTNNTNPCNDSNACTTNDVCGGGSCAGTPIPPCNDSNVCTTDTCDPALGCVFTNNTNPCSDNNACTTPDVCSGGNCISGPAPDCDDHNPCTTDTCDGGSGCIHTNNTNSCNDANACTMNDVCGGGTCAGTPVPPCNDSNPCTTDTCNPSSGCVFTNNTNPCNDGNACTTTDTCGGGACIPGPPLVCLDNNVCNGVETCNPAIGCVPGTPLVCNDNNPCTMDSCSVELGVCVFPNVASGQGTCTDGNPCTSYGGVPGGLDHCDGNGGCVNPPVNCPNDGNPCTVDTCSNGVCSSTPGNAGAVCRAANGVCDAPELCTGSSVNCPASGGYAPAGTVCRAAQGGCDKVETCTGSSAVCPNDVKQPSGYVCRAAVPGGCDVQEVCSGTSYTCPNDAYRSSSTVCRASAGTCDVQENCPGNGPLCPPDAFKLPTTVCRTASGICDIAENCTGSSATCPNNGYQPASVVCRAASGVCDRAENCTGSSTTCPSNTYQPSTTVCRAAADLCDKPETCTGSATTCPSDIKQPAGTTCRAVAGPCDKAETCNGSSITCPTDTYQNSSTVCRAAAGICDNVENCTGAGIQCPTDTFKPAGIVCRPPVNPCDTIAEMCTGNNGVCPPDGQPMCSYTLYCPPPGDSSPSPYGTLSWSVLPNGDLSFRFDQSRAVNDNSYGVNSIGWKSNRPHRFSDLYNSDQAEFIIKNANGQVVFDFYMDYITASAGTPSGYRSLGCTGGDGSVVSGNSAWLIDFNSSQARNLNDYGYCVGGNCNTCGGIDLKVNSPPATNAYIPLGPCYPSWNYTDAFEGTVSHLAFGSSSFGSIDVGNIHNSPPKAGSAPINPVPCAGPQAPWVCSTPWEKIKMVWADPSNRTVKIKAHIGGVATAVIATVDNIAVGSIVTVSGYTPSPTPAAVVWEIYLAGTTTKIGESVFNLTCADPDMNMPEDCGKYEGDAIAQPGYINTWVLKGIQDSDQEFFCN